jgi:hypothetical protein
MWNVPTHKEEPWERDRRRVGEQRAREAWEKRQRELGLPLGGWSSGTSARKQTGAVLAPDPWTAAQRLLVIVALGGVLITLTILLVFAIREQREEAGGASATSTPARLLSPQNARSTAVLQR